MVRLQLDVHVVSQSCSFVSTWKNLVILEHSHWSESIASISRFCGSMKPNSTWLL